LRNAYLVTTASVLLVFGGGVRRLDNRYTLTPASEARVRHAVDYATAHRSSLVVFSGGWPRGRRAPPMGSREADLMAALAARYGLDRRARLLTEVRSRSTAENLIQARELLGDHSFDAEQPLGLVSHQWHLPRIRLLAGRLLGLHELALLDIPVPGRRSAREAIACCIARVRV
jgi:uncharacterized SAM-binding protein YcdF (DUF218 family)